MRLNTFWTINFETVSAICHYAKQTVIKMMYSFIPHLYFNSPIHVLFGLELVVVFNKSEFY